MRFLLGWLFRLGFLGMAYLAVTGNLQFKLPASMLGYEVPAEVRQWVERNAQINDLAGKTETSLKQISDRLRSSVQGIEGASKGPEPRDLRIARLRARLFRIRIFCRLLLPGPCALP